MKKLFIILLLFLIGCTNQVKLEFSEIDILKSSNDGIYDISACRAPGYVISRGEEFIFTSEEDYQKYTDSVLEKIYQNYLRELGNSGKIQNPEYTLEEYKSACNIFNDIDVSNKMIIGKYVCGSGCERYFDKQVFLDEDDKEITYVITVHEKGGCLPSVCGQNFISINKDYQNYKISFKVKQ